MMLVLPVVMKLPRKLRRLLVLKQEKQELQKLQ